MPTCITVLNVGMLLYTHNGFNTTFIDLRGVSAKVYPVCFESLQLSRTRFIGNQILNFAKQIRPVTIFFVLQYDG